MNNCRDCQHWDKAAIDEIYSYADCDEPEKANDIPGKRRGVCKLTEMRDIGRYEKAAAPLLAEAQDGSDYKAYLITREDFGCVQFERKADGA